MSRLSCAQEKGSSARSRSAVRLSNAGTREGSELKTELERRGYEVEQSCSCYGEPQAEFGSDFIRGYSNILTLLP
ncbi:hypothetical protein ACFL2D_00140 [Patescibacteria group bacterium]